MTTRKDVAVVLRKLAQFDGLSDGAKVMFLEFLYHFWSDDKEIPSYTRLTEILGVARSTVQLHVEELEKTGLVVSVRMPNKRKRYRSDLTVLDKKHEAQPTKDAAFSKFKKPVSKYATHEVCGYFYFLLSEMVGETRSMNRVEHNRMRPLHHRYGSTVLIAAINYFHRTHKRRKEPFSMMQFLDNVNEYIERSSAK